MFRLILILFFVSLVSCSEQPEQDEVNYEIQLEHSKLLIDSALSELELIYQTNDSLLNKHFPKL